MPLIGLTGGIATGKSAVTRLLAAQGAVTFSADEAARAVLARERVYPPVVQREIDVCQHLDRAEPLDDAAHFDGRGHVARSGLGVAHRRRAGRGGPACRAGIRTDSPSRSPP